jgi:chemotaxis protein MotB
MTPETSTNAARKRTPRQRTGPTWITTYADAVTILLAFFVILYSMSEIDVQKFTAFLEGLRVPFGNESGEGLLPATDGLQPDHPPPSPITGLTYRDTPDLLDPEQVDGDDADQDTRDDADLDPRDEREWDHQRDDLDVLTAQAVAAQQRLEEIAMALDEALRDEGLEEHVELRREERGLVVSIASDDILFALGSTDLGAVGRSIIQVVSDTLEGFPNPLLVEGHTDNVPLNRNGYTNWNLSTDRAVEVLQLMIEEHGLPSDRVGAVGYSEYHPLESNDTAAGRARNRRVDIVVLVSASGLDDRRTSEEEGG